MVYIQSTVPFSQTYPNFSHVSKKNLVQICLCQVFQPSSINIVQITTTCFLSGVIKRCRDQSGKCSAFYSFHYVCGVCIWNQPIVHHWDIMFQNRVSWSSGCYWISSVAHNDLDLPAFTSQMLGSWVYIKLYLFLGMDLRTSCMLGENSTSSPSPVLEIISVKSSLANCTTKGCLSVSFSSLIPVSREFPWHVLSFLTECVSETWHLSLVMTTGLQSFTLFSVSVFLKTESLGSCNDKLWVWQHPCSQPLLPMHSKEKAR